MEMKRFNVTLQVLVNVRVANVEADSPIGAIEAAEGLVDASKLGEAVKSKTNCPAGAEWAELAEDPPAYALVDHIGDDDLLPSRWYFNYPATDWQPVKTCLGLPIEPVANHDDEGED